jgi:hypothetical protein
VKELSRDESQEIRLEDLLAVKAPAIFGGADISIVLYFQPWFAPIPWSLEYRFQTRLEGDGKLSWVPRPLNK